MTSVPTKITPRLHSVVAVLAFVSGALGMAASESSEPDTADDWETFLQETEAFLEITDYPLESIGLDDPVSSLFWSAELTAGTGYSQNFLKRNSPVGSRYLKTGGDAYLNFLGEENSVTALAFFEVIQYAEEYEADREVIAFFHLNWTRLGKTASTAVELEAFYGDQIYDASLSDTTPEGASLRQWRPEISVLREWLQEDGDSLTLRGTVRRAFFEESENDYWGPTLSLEWQTTLAPSLLSESALSAYGEFYDEDVTRDALGLPTDPESSLSVHGLRFEQSLDWQPDPEGIFRTILRAGASIEDEQEGVYTDALRFWGSITGKVKTDFLVLKLTGRIQETRYDDRQTGILDERLLRQTFRLLSLEIEKPLAHGWTATLRGELTDFNSRDMDESFYEKRFEALLGWTY